MSGPFLNPFLRYFANDRSPDADKLPQRRRVLIVDDNQDAADSLAMLLSLHGFDTSVAYDGNGALTTAARFRPHVAVVDIGLPGMDGHELARALRSGGSQPTPLLLIALSGYGGDVERQRSHASGFDAHLVKPVEPADVLALLALGNAAPDHRPPSS